MALGRIWQHVKYSYEEWQPLQEQLVDYDLNLVEAFESLRSNISEILQFERQYEEIDQEFFERECQRKTMNGTSWKRSIIK